MMINKNAIALIQASIVTLVSLFIITISINWISVSSLFSPVEGHADFQLYDLYTRVANKRSVSYCSDKIVVLATDGCSRKDIVRMIDIVSNYSPAAIGVDINFQYPSENDSYLLSVIGERKNIVLPLIVSQDNNSDKFIIEENKNSFLTTCLNRDMFSVVNLERHSMFGHVRTFRPLYNIGDSLLPSFPMRLAELASNEKAKELLRRGYESEYINYQSRSFEIYTFEEVITKEIMNTQSVEDIFRDKIIIIGDLHNSKDFFPVPHTEMLPGILIHAYCVDAILSSNHIDVMPQWICVLLSLVLCFAFSYAQVHFKRPLKYGGDFVIRVFQVLLMFLLYWLGCVMFVHNYYIDMSFVILMIFTNTLSMDVCLGIKQIWYHLNNKLK